MARQKFYGPSRNKASWSRSGASVTRQARWKQSVTTGRSPSMVGHLVHTSQHKTTLGAGLHGKLYSHTSSVSSTPTKWINSHNVTAGYMQSHTQSTHHVNAAKVAAVGAAGAAGGYGGYRLYKHFHNRRSQEGNIT